jgi:hypothetical protein
MLASQVPFAVVALIIIGITGGGCLQKAPHQHDTEENQSGCHCQPKYGKEIPTLHGVSVYMLETKTLGVAEDGYGIAAPSERQALLHPRIVVFFGVSLILLVDAPDSPR